jgi:hypothetical protein
LGFYILPAPHLVARLHPRKLTTEYFIVILLRVLMAIATGFKQVDENADNFSLVYDPKTLKEMKEVL